MATPRVPIRPVDPSSSVLSINHNLTTNYPFSDTLPFLLDGEFDLIYNGTSGGSVNFVNENDNTQVLIDGAIYYTKKSTAVISEGNSYKIILPSTGVSELYLTEGTHYVQVKIHIYTTNPLSPIWLTLNVADICVYSTSEAQTKILTTIYKVVRELTGLSTITHGNVNYVMSNNVLPIFPSDKVNKVNDVNTYIGTDKDKDCIGFIELGTTADNTPAKLNFFENIANPYGADSNITIKYPKYNADYPTRIAKCRFGKVFNGRLFVSGNPDYKNCDWHTSAITTAFAEDSIGAKGNYTYFSDLDYCFYGSTETAVLGYDTYSDGDLIVFKESSTNEATLYRREYKFVTATDYQGNSYEDLGEEQFPCFDINTNGGEGAINSRCIVNFGGDTLFLTKTGLKALTTKSTIESGSYYSVDVSKKINNLLFSNNNFFQSSLAVIDRRLLLSIGDKTYVAHYDLRDDDSIYEWFPTDVEMDKVFTDPFTNEDEIFFTKTRYEGTTLYSDLYKFNKNTFQDNDKNYLLTSGQLTLTNHCGEEIAYSSSYDEVIQEGQKFYFNGKDNDGNKINLMKLACGKIVENEGDILLNTDNTCFIDKVSDTNGHLLKIYCYRNSATDHDKQNHIKHNFDNSTAQLFTTGKAFYLVAFSTKEYFASSKYILKQSALDEYAYEVYNASNTLPLTRVTNLTSFIGMSLACMYEPTKIYFKDTTNHIIKLVEFQSYDYATGLPNRTEPVVFAKNGVSAELPSSYEGCFYNYVNYTSLYIPRVFDFGSTTNYKTIVSFSIVNDTALESEMDLGFITSRTAGGYDMIIRSTAGTRQIYTGNNTMINFDLLQFTNDKLPHIYSRQKMLPRVTFARFIFKNDKGTNMVLSKLSIIYMLGQMIKGVR